MSAVLNPAPPIISGESPESYVWRLALTHGFDDATEFGRIVGIDFARVVRGEKTTLAFVAELVGLPAEIVGADALVRGKDGYRLRHAKLLPHSLRRSRVVACPACLRDDQLAGRPMHVRATWSISHIRTCVDHGLPLVEVGQSDRGRLGMDLSCILRMDNCRIEALTESVKPREASAFERYVVRRVFEGEDDGWLDTMPLHAAAKACDLIGMLDVHGPGYVIGRLTDDERHCAAAAGYEIARRGPAELERFLEKCHRAPSHMKKTIMGPQAWFGPLYTTFSFGRPQSGLDPLRDVIRDYVIDKTPVGAGVSVLGKTVDYRRVHTVWTAFAETKVHPTRLRKILRKLGYIGNTAGMTAHEIEFDALETADILRRLTTALTALELAPYLETNRIQAALLVRDGLLKPVVADDNGDIGWEVFARSDVDQFLSRLQERADPELAGVEGMLNIVTAAKRACCHSTEIVRGVLDGSLRRIGKAANAGGYSSVLVDIEEVRQLVRGEELDGMTVDAACRKMKLNPTAMKHLVDKGILRTSRQRHPVSRIPLRIVSHADLQAFRSTYVALFDASAALQIHPVKLKKALAAIGTLPAFDPEEIKATFYRRSEVPLKASEFDPALIAIKWPKRQAERGKSR